MENIFSARVCVIRVFLSYLTISINKKSHNVNLNSHNQTQTVINSVGIEKETKIFFQKRKRNVDFKNTSHYNNIGTYQKCKIPFSIT